MHWVDVESCPLLVVFVYCPVSTAHGPLSTVCYILSIVHCLQLVHCLQHDPAHSHFFSLLSCFTATNSTARLLVWPQGTYTEEEYCLPAGPGQAGHALPPPPMGMGGMQMGGAMQPPPAKKPAVPDWVRQELLKRGLHSDAAGGRCSISRHAIFCQAVPSIAGHMGKVSLAQEAHACMLDLVRPVFQCLPCGCKCMQCCYMHWQLAISAHYNKSKHLCLVNFQSAEGFQIPAQSTTCVMSWITMLGVHLSRPCLV